MGFNHQVPKISLGTWKIRIDLRVILTVRDDGPGIDESVRDRLFDPFVSTKLPGQGTGLGLSICYGIVKRYDGEIRVISQPGEGATFHVVLRVHETPNAARSNSSERG